MSPGTKVLDRSDPKAQLCNTISNRLWDQKCQIHGHCSCLPSATGGITCVTKGEVEGSP
jgi:hypothetical protein